MQERVKQEGEHKEKARPVPLRDVAVGEVATVGIRHFIVLEQLEDRTVLFQGNCYDYISFGDSNDYRESNARAYCREVAEELEEIVGDRLIPHRVDLSSDSGAERYGDVQEKVSLLTKELAWKYAEQLDRVISKIMDPIWLATPVDPCKSFENHFDQRFVRIIRKPGEFWVEGSCDCAEFGIVCPYLIMQNDAPVILKKEKQKGRNV